MVEAHRQLVILLVYKYESKIIFFNFRCKSRLRSKPTISLSAISYTFFSWMSLGNFIIQCLNWRLVLFQFQMKAKVLSLVPRHTRLLRHRRADSDNVAEINCRKNVDSGFVLCYTHSRCFKEKVKQGKASLYYVKLLISDWIEDWLWITTCDSKLVKDFFKI